MLVWFDIMTLLVLATVSVFVEKNNSADAEDGLLHESERIEIFIF